MSGENACFELVLAYCEAILSGEIKASQKLKWAVKRFLNDLEEIRTNPNSPYYFDEREVEDFFYWAQEFEHVEGVLAGQKVELVPFQLFIAANIFGFKRNQITPEGFERYTSS